MFPLWPGRLLGGLLLRNRFIIGSCIIRILDCLAGQQDWRESQDGNGVKGAVCSKLGGGSCKHGGGLGNKGSGLDAGTPRCSCWIRTQAAVCLSQDDVMAASFAAHRLSQYSPNHIVGTRAGFPAGRIRYTEQTNRYWGR